MYKFETQINPQVYDAFVSHHSLSSLLQSYNWYGIKQEWNYQHFLIYKGHDIVGAGLLLYRKIGKLFHIGYLPRGPILDYSNKVLLTFVMAELKKLAEQLHLDMIIFDPKIIYRHVVHGREKVDKKALIIKENLEQLGVRHVGFTEQLSATIQPRHEAIISLEQPVNKIVHSSAQQIVRRTLKKHISLVENNHKRLKDFFNILSNVEKRHGIRLRSLMYFERFKMYYPDTLYISFAELHVNDVRLKVVERIKQLTRDSAIYTKSTHKQKLIDDEKTMLTKYLSDLQEITEDIVVLACDLSIGYGDTYDMLYGGVSDVLKSINAQYALDYYLIERAQQLGFSKVSMGGVSNDEMDGLQRYKKKFGAHIDEYIGEFHLINDKWKYYWFRQLQKIVRYMKAGR